MPRLTDRGVARALICRMREKSTPLSRDAGCMAQFTRIAIRMERRPRWRGARLGRLAQPRTRPTRAREGRPALSQRLFQRGCRVGLVVAVLHDDRRRDLQLVLLSEFSEQWT